MTKILTQRGVEAAKPTGKRYGKIFLQALPGCKRVIVRRGENLGEEQGED